MINKLDFEPKHKKIKDFSKKAGEIFDVVAPKIIIVGLVAAFAILMYYLDDALDKSFESGEFLPEYDQAIVMEVDGETVALPIRSYRTNAMGDLVIRDADGNVYTVPKEDVSTLVFGEDALHRARELANELQPESNDVGGKSL